jgi:hypothetical protein
VANVVAMEEEDDRGDGDDRGYHQPHRQQEKAQR